MRLIKSGQIANVCQANALMTLKEYLEDYASESTKGLGEQLIQEEILHIASEKVREIVTQNLSELNEGKRDFRF